MNTKVLFVILIAFSLALTGCAAPSVSNIEQQQQQSAVSSIVQNQPIPDLGGYSFERQIVIETYLARNNTISTYSYMITMDGKIIEICPSIGYPIPYSTQLSNPLKYEYTGGGPAVLGNAEANGLYPPGDAAATLVQCVQPDGKVSPVYIEWYVMAFPYQIVSDVKLQQVGETSFSVGIGR
jgi:hypothetical protein